MCKKNRRSNLELMRIVCMFLILMSHCDTIFGLSSLYKGTIGIQQLITDWLEIGGQIGVGGFLLISGYFLIDKPFSSKRLLKVLGEVWFYSIGFWACWVAAKFVQGELVLKAIIPQTIKSFFPVTTRFFWFVTAYMMMLFFAPFMNKLIHALNARGYKLFLAVLIIILVLYTGGIPIEYPDNFIGLLVPVFMVYFFAGYIKRFRTEKKNNASRHCLIAVILYLLLLFSPTVLTILGTKLHIEYLVANRYYLRRLNSPLVVGICIEMFLSFIELDLKYNKIINEIAGCTFGVFLIHQNLFFKPILIKLFPIYRQTNPLLLFVYTLGSVIIIYVLCTIIDFIRRKTVEKIWISFLNNYWCKIENKMKVFALKLFSRAKKVATAYYSR